MRPRLSSCIGSAPARRTKEGMPFLWSALAYVSGSTSVAIRMLFSTTDLPMLVAPTMTVLYTSVVMSEIRL